MAAAAASPVRWITVPIDDRRTRLVLVALTPDTPDRGPYWTDEFTVCRRTGLSAVTTFRILEQLESSGAVEKRAMYDSEAPTPRGGSSVHYRLTNSGLSRSAEAARNALTRFSVWRRRRSSAATARLARERF